MPAPGKEGGGIERPILMNGFVGWGGGCNKPAGLGSATPVTARAASAGGGMIGCWVGSI